MKKFDYCDDLTKSDNMARLPMREMRDLDMQQKDMQKAYEETVANLEGTLAWLKARASNCDEDALFLLKEARKLLKEVKVLGKSLPE